MRETPDIIREMQAVTAGGTPAARAIAVLTAPWGVATFVRVYCVAIALAIVLSLTGAVGTGALPHGERILYWLAVMLAGTVTVQIISLGLDRWLQFDPLPEAVVQFVSVTPGVTLVVWLVTSAFSRSVPNLLQLRGVLVPVVCVTAFMCTIQYLMRREPQQSHEHAPEAAQSEAVAGEAFHQRLPFKFRQAELYALSAEDHYLRVHTSAGTTLILMRLYDAIRALDGIEGSQVHRSWWVAKDAVSNVTRNDGKLSLTLKGGVTAPVSRGYTKALKEGGWL